MSWILVPSGARRIPVASLDGSVGAPSGTTQHPNLFTLDAHTASSSASYPSRPSWNVAGVDYHVGIDRAVYPANANLKDPATASLPSGVSRTGTSMTISGNNVLLDGFDFSLGGGWDLTVNGNNGIVQNCNWVATKFCLSVNGGGTLVQKCEFDINAPNANVDPGFGWNAANNSTTTMQWCWIKNGWGVAFNAGNPCVGQTWIYKWNLIENSGIGFAINGAHGDWFQSYDVSGSTAQEQDFLYNTCIQNMNISVARCQGLSIFSAGTNTSSVNKVRIENNTLVSHQTGVDDVPNSAGAYVNFAILCDWHFVTTNGGTILNNYIDQIGMDSGIYGGPDFGGHGPPWGMPFIMGNVDMRNGPITSWADQYHPVVVSTAFSIGRTDSVQTVGIMTAYLGPTTWSITAGNGAGFFSIDNNGVITVSAAVTANTYVLTCLADNSNATLGSAVSGTATITVS